MSSTLINPILLVGAQQIIQPVNGVEPLLRFYGDLYARLTKEARHTGELTRYVGFQSPSGDNGVLHFFGIEVSKIEAIPAGMIAWELSDQHRTIWENKAGDDVIISQEEIDWQWLSPSPTANRRYTGEFTGHNTTGDAQPYWISANAYVGLHEIDVSSDEIILMDHDSAWQQQYEETAQWLRQSLGSNIVLRTEHFGSTAIPGIPAKPIIDILV
jgi:hypothetical protein